MDILNRILGSKNRELKIGVLGPSKSGKTTLIRYLETGEEQVKSPRTTLGFEYREKGFTFQNINFKVYDTGGQELYQEIFWDIVVSSSDIIFYLVDAVVTKENNAELLEAHIEQFSKFCDLLDEDNKVIILLNKQDLEDNNPMKAQEFKDHYPLSKINIKALGIEMISAKFGSRIPEVLKWVTEVVD